jgi:hypothetical protein
MVDHIDNDARKEEEHMTSQHPVVSTSVASKNHYIDVFINELLLLIITTHIN